VFRYKCATTWYSHSPEPVADAVKHALELHLRKKYAIMSNDKALLVCDSQ
jgi:hypothetical protein